MKFKKVGLVLGGGGGKGSYQIGVYKYLKERGFVAQIQGISANSIGALNLSLLASGNVEMAEEIWTGLKRSQILTLKNVREYFQKGSFSIFSREGMLAIFQDIDLTTLSNSSLDLFVSTYDETVGRGEIFKLSQQSVGDIIKIISASSAIPKVFPPVLINDHQYSDGYQSDNCPIQPLIKEQYDLIFVIPLGSNGAPRPKEYQTTHIIDFVDETVLESGTWKGTLGFDAKISLERIQQGYDNAKQLIEYLESIDYFETSIWERIKEWWRTKIRHLPPKYANYYCLKDIKK
ncbi:MAG: patatin-like phospholipase family protein [Bacilli bacterium]|nr:patatin-like phospholipase family protein [Bacilli bacterium]MDD3422267.1 patatin-like phospholipase family protein [Bacilli bacterium]MDD4065670.1 patatin-like phospholipase family protein [Bacilli bacterium]